MTKQTIMETYVDECLDEVEIRGIFIQEGVTDTPLNNILRDLNKNLKNADKQVSFLKDRLSGLKAWVNKYSYKVDDIRSSLDNTSLSLSQKKAGQSYLTKNIKALGKSEEDVSLQNRRIKYANDQVRRIQNAIKTAKENPGVLGNVPYIYQIIGATAIIAAIGYTSYRLYKRFMSKAAKTCQGKKGKMKTICMNQYQIKGLEVSKKPLTDGIRGCSKAKEVQACKVKFNKKINAINKKISKKQNQIKKLMSKK